MTNRAFVKVFLVLIFLKTIVEKTYPEDLNPELLFCINFMLKKPCLKFPKSATKIFGLKIITPPPLALFRKFIRFGSLTLPSVFRKPQRKKTRQFEYFPVVSSNFFMYSLAFGLNHGAENFH